jgi:hypothetical protein
VASASRKAGAATASSATWVQPRLPFIDQQQSGEARSAEVPVLDQRAVILDLLRRLAPRDARFA